MPDPILTQIAEALRPIIREELERALRSRSAEPERLLTVHEACQILNCSSDYIYRTKDLPFVIRNGRSVRISHRKLMAWLDKPV